MKVFSVWAYFVLALAIPGAFAEEPDIPYVFSISGISDELSQQSVRQVYQDSQGFLWILTQEGLNRYDGRAVDIYRPDVNIPGTLSGSYTRGITEDSEGRIWIATQGGGLNRYLPASNTFTSLRSSGDPLKSPASDRIWSLSQLSNGKIWLGYREGGFSVFDPDVGLFKHYVKQRWRELEHPVTDFVQYTKDSILIATDGGGLYLFDLGKEELTQFAAVSGGKFSLFSDHIEDIYLRSDGRLWIASNDAGVGYLDIQKGQLRRVTNLRNQDQVTEILDLASTEFLRIFEDSEGRMLFATTSGIGLYYPKGESIQLFNEENSNLISSRAVSIFEDRSGRYWLGTFSGLSEGFISQFYSVNASNGLLDETILSFSQSDDGVRWIGTANGLYRIPRDGSLNRLELYLHEDLIDIPITALMAEDNTLWVGTFSEGLLELNLLTGKITSHGHVADDPTTLSGDAITKVMRDSFGNLWVGTSRSGVNLMLAGASGFIRYEHVLNDESSLSNNTVYTIYQEKNGDLWFGTSRGLNRFNYEVYTFERFQHDAQDSSGLAADVVYSMFEDEQARLWIGTSGGGLAMWEPVDRKRSHGKFEHWIVSAPTASSSTSSRILSCPVARCTPFMGMQTTISGCLPRAELPALTSMRV
jgi:ligand-binding sensor domain-containing protein